MMKLAQFNISVADKCGVFITVAADGPKGRRGTPEHGPLLGQFPRLIILQRGSKVCGGHLHTRKCV